MGKLKVLDLFSGIGGFSLGLERTGGFETVAFCEIAKFPQRILRARVPKTPLHDEITSMQFSEGEVDVITGGFPCQDLSAQGLRAGLAGTRSGLWRELLRAIRVVRPRYAVVENVADLLGLGMGTVLGDLASIGYDAEWHCIPACYVGAPHERDRIWIVAHPSEEQGLYQSDYWEAPTRLPTYSDYWRAHPWDETSPKLCRMDDGIPHRVDRTEGLGNAVVPQIPELIGNAILQSLEAA
jgi:DNA (cytosine-5)-methyltransferase 1